MLNFHSTWSLVDSQTAFPVVGWTFIFQFHYYLSSEGTWAWVEDSRWRTTQVRVRDRRSARESSWKHWDGLRCLGNSIYSTLLETQQILLRHLQNIGTEFGDWTMSFVLFDLLNYNLKYHYFYFLKKTSTICMDAWMIEWMDGKMDRCGWTDGDGWMDGGGWMGGWTDGWMMDRWMGVWVYGWMVMDGLMDG